MYSISVERVAFRRSAPLRVTGLWMGESGKRSKIDFGSVVFGLRQALIVLEARGKIIPSVTDLSPSHSQRSGYVIGVNINDDPRMPGTWTVTPGEGKILSGSAYFPELATIRTPAETAMQIRVEASNQWVEVDYRPNGAESANNSDQDKARRHLIQQVLKIALSENSKREVFSSSGIIERRSDG